MMMMTLNMEIKMKASVGETGLTAATAASAVGQHCYVSTISPTSSTITASSSTGASPAVGQQSIN